MGFRDSPAKPSALSSISPVLTAVLEPWNADADDSTRRKIDSYGVSAAGTAWDGEDEWRVWMAIDWLVHRQLPVWLDLALLSEQAECVRAVSAICDRASAERALKTLKSVNDASLFAARDTFGDTTIDAVWAAVGKAGLDGVWNGIWHSSESAAGAEWGEIWESGWGEVADAVFDSAWGAMQGAVRSAAIRVDGNVLSLAIIDLRDSTFELLEDLRHTKFPKP
jgi:hypothetical protein